MSDQYPYQQQQQQPQPQPQPQQPQQPQAQPQPSYDQHGQHGQYDQYGQYDEYGQPVPQPPFPYEPQPDHQQYTQTWEGQTWDTQYQPTIPPAPQQEDPAPYRPRHAQPWQESGQDGTGAGYAGAGTTSVPLPPEVPMAASGPGRAPVYEPAARPGAHAAPGASGDAGVAEAPGLGPGAAGDGASGLSGASGVPGVSVASEGAGADQAGSGVHRADGGAGAAAAGAGADAGAGGPAYSPPTTVGNARVTDAQRARAEGRSPIIAPGMRPAALTAVLGLLLAVAAPAGPYALVVPLIALQAVTAAGWFRLNGMWPARQGIALAFAGALVADVALLALGREHAPAAILGTLGVWVLLTLVIQLRSHADPDERMYGLMATVASTALAILAGGYLAAPPHAVSVGAAAVAVAALARALPLPSAASVAVALLAAAGAGIAVGGLTGIGAAGALLGLAAGACALIGLRVASYDYPSRFVHMTAGVALPLTAAVPVLYLIGRAVA
ncbi:hypothetical protein ACFYM2_30235 [Streptomyces sp. NPDC006711]|uniref:hypothetical protein n=1 Tax=Streptomyces sp. NPDC006711 TaxID=3364762 RepID=UPI003673F4DB